jgi:parallel beta-helix repeat protein
VLIVVDSTISKNETRGSAGAGLRNDGGSVTLVNSTISENTGPILGGGISNTNSGTLTITNSTISGNKANQPNFATNGGGIHNIRGAFVGLNNVTITDNEADDAGGIFNEGGSTVRLENTIIAANRDLFASTTGQLNFPASSSPDCLGELTSLGFNFIGDSGFLIPRANVTGPPACDGLIDSINHDQVGISHLIPERRKDPLLLPLAAKESDPTMTHVPRTGSPVVDKGNPENCPPTDQRRLVRPVGVCDIGAVEADARELATTPQNPLPRSIMESTKLDQDQTEGIVIKNDEIVLDCAGHTIGDPNHKTAGIGIQLNRRTGVTVKNCIVTNFTNGFNVVDSMLNTLTANTATNNLNDGFHIVRSEGNTFTGNLAVNNGDDGFDLDTAVANFFSMNSAEKNKDKGFTLDFSSGNFFVGNTSDENHDPTRIAPGRGFLVQNGSRYNPFAGNVACNNGRFDFEEKSHPNFFHSNEFCKEFGVRIGEGLRLLRLDIFR